MGGKHGMMGLVLQGGYGMGDEERVEPWMAGRVA